MEVSASLWMKDAGILVFTPMACADSAEAACGEGHLWAGLSPLPQSGGGGGRAKASVWLHWGTRRILENRPRGEGLGEESLVEEGGWRIVMGADRGWGGGRAGKQETISP